MPLFSRELKTVTIDVKSIQNLVSISVQNDNLKGSYEETRFLTGDTTLPATKFTVDRTLSKLDQEVQDWVAQGAVFVERFRQEDEAQRAADLANAAANLAAQEAIAAAAAIP